MMYEIYMEPQGGRWRIRIITVSALFFQAKAIVTQKVQAQGSIPTYDPLEFDTYGEAEAHVVKVGIDKAYRKVDRAKSYTTWVHATGGNDTLEAKHA